jgi:predicted esterase
MSERSGREKESGFHYLTFLPSSEASGNSVVVYLHGIGERGEDLSLVKRYGLPALLAGGHASINCPVVCPQLEAGNNWEPARVATFIKAVAAQPLKTALIGYSLGASGVCEVIGRFGAVVGQAVAIAGQAPHPAEVSQAGVSLLAIQGELDSWPSTTGFVESVISLGGRASSVTLPGLGHYVSEQAVLHSSCASALQAVGIKITVSQNAG